ncbi:response regulator, partial [Candidatus Dependentiae bacterium]|nr:response regulator [Candidatus Dependentiae bacterium]
MTTILYLNPYNKSNLTEKDIISETLSENLVYKFKIVEDLTITQYIDELADIIVTEYIDDDLLNNFYFELQIFTKSYMIPVIYVIEPEKINKFPVSFIDDSSDFIYKPVNKSELVSRIKLAILKNSQLKNNVQIDRVTGIPNYKSFYRRFNEETLKCLRYKRTMSVSIIHIKNLSDLKNEIGWYYCDLIMAELAFLIKKSLREVDYLARYSFDKFIILLPETDDFNSRIAMSRIIEKIKYYIYVLPEDSKKEISVIANAATINYPEITNDSIELIKILNNTITAFTASNEFGIEIITNACLAKRNILIIEDDAEIFNFIKDLLADKNIELVWLTKSTPDIHKIIIEQKICLAIIDIMLPDSEKDGYEIIDSLKNNKLTENVTILVITAKGGPLKIMESGADDYLLKPFDSNELINKINIYLNKRIIQYSNKMNEQLIETSPNSYYSYLDK